MKKITALFFCVLIACLSNAQITFQKTFGTVSNEGGTACAQTTDGGYISAGPGEVWGKTVMVKTDAQGNIVWSKNYLFNGATYSEIRHVLQTEDYGFLINGYGEISSSNSDIFIIRTDSAGNLLWSKTFGDFSQNYSYRADETSDGGFVIVGSSSGLTCLLIKLDGNGNLLWSKMYNGASEGFDVRQTADGGFCIASSIEDAGGAYDMLLIKTDSAGNFLWAKSYGAGDWEDAGSVRQTADGGYIVSGAGGNLFSNAFDFLLIRTDNTGNLVWAKTYGGPGWEFATWVDQTADGGFVSGGTWGYANAPDYYLIKTDSTGNLLWSNRYGGAGNEVSWGCGGKTSDEGFIMTTNTNLGIGMNDILLIKTDNNGNSGCHQAAASTNVNTPVIQVLSQSLFTSSSGNIASAFPVVSSGGNDSTLCYNNFPTELNNVSEIKNSISIYPNPATHQFTVYGLRSSISEIEIYSVHGKQIFSQQPGAANQQSITIDISEWGTGIYFLRVQSDNVVKTEKISVVR